jgi:hypothetical protein
MILIDIHQKVASIYINKDQELVNLQSFVKGDNINDILSKLLSIFLIKYNFK